MFVVLFHFASLQVNRQPSCEIDFEIQPPDIMDSVDVTFVSDDNGPCDQLTTTKAYDSPVREYIKTPISLDNVVKATASNTTHNTF